MLLKYCRSYIVALNLASILSIASAGTVSIAPTMTTTIAPTTTSATIIPAIPLPITSFSNTYIPPVGLNPLIVQPAAASNFQINYQSTPSPALVSLVPTTPLAPVTFQPQSTTIQPLAAVYELAVMEKTVNEKRNEDAVQIELRRAQEELNYKYRKEYENVVKEKIEISKEKEKVLIQLQAQLKLQLEAQQFATLQRARAIQEMQNKLAQEAIKAKADAEALKLNVQSIVDLSPLILNVTQNSADKANSPSFDFSNLKNAQNGASSCKHGKHESDCNKHSTHCSWGRVEKKKNDKCLFMCEKLSQNLCSKVSGCYYKNEKCRNK